ncbi:MAG: tetratricopeptide repeat protein [Candidatus Auribacterota bacterium]|nr:tetratricopeptide repeat protein [Candidatus Auribacterota bacterium]
MRLHPDVSWKYLARWEKEHQWLTPARIGKLHFQKHEVGRARKQLETAVEEGASDGRLLYELGYCCLVQEDNEKAFEYLSQAAEKLVRDAPDHIYHFNSEYLIGTIYEEQNSPDSALTHYDNALALRPETPALHYRKAYLLHKRGNFAQSLNEIEQVIKLSPHSGSAAYLAGIISLENGDLSAARTHILNAIKNGEENNASYFCLGFISSRQGRGKEAIEYYKQALELEPDHRETLLALANRYYEEDNLSAAREYFESLVAEEPDSARRHYNLGVVYRGLDMNEAAEKELAEARRLDPDLVFLSRPAGDDVPELFAAGARLQREGKQREAIALYRRALFSDPFYLPTRYNLAIAYNARGERSRAIRQYSRLLRINPDFSPAHLNLGILAYKKKQRTHAAFHLRKYLSLEPESPREELIKRYLHDLRGW